MCRRIPHRVCCGLHHETCDRIQPGVIRPIGYALRHTMEIIMRHTTIQAIPWGLPWDASWTASSSWVISWGVPCCIPWEISPRATSHPLPIRRPGYVQWAWNYRMEYLLVHTTGEVFSLSLQWGDPHGTYYGASHGILGGLPPPKEHAP